jgi:hypothetical protein
MPPLSFSSQSGGAAAALQKSAWFYVTPTLLSVQRRSR